MHTLEGNDFASQMFSYQKMQFKNADSGYITPYLKNFELLNNEILKYRDADTFWLVFTIITKMNLFIILP